MNTKDHTSAVKRLILTFLLITGSLCTFAQKEQDGDTLIWNNRKYAIHVDRYRPSIVQDYFLRQVEESPFKAWSTNNNRGHIAFFELIDNEIRLDSIEAKRFRTRTGNLWTESGIDTLVLPDYFEIHSQRDTIKEGEVNPVIDWFTGVLQLRFVPSNKKEQKLDEVNGERWLMVMEGKVVNEEFLTDKELVKLEMELLSAQGDFEAMPARMKMRILQRRLDTFYQHCAAEREEVSYMGHIGLFDHRSASLSLLMELYDNDPFAYDLEHDYTADIASPLRRWKIINDTVFLDDERRTWADWLNGEYIIHYGNWQEDAMGVPDYRVYKTQKIRLSNGVIKSSKFSPRSFEDDEAALKENTFAVCDANNIFSVEDKQLWETVGKLKAPKKNPTYEGNIGNLRARLQVKHLTDERAKDRLFRVRIGFLINCKGEVGQWTILNRGKGELNEFAEMVLDLVKEIPPKWEPAQDKKGNKLDCWQILELTVSNGSLINVNYK